MIGSARYYCLSPLIVLLVVAEGTPHEIDLKSRNLYNEIDEFFLCWNQIILLLLFSPTASHESSPLHSTILHTPFFNAALGNKIPKVRHTQCVANQ